MADELKKWFSDLDLEELRIVRPSKFLFLCGGAIGNDKETKRPENLRDYLWRVRPIKSDYNIILAEDAYQLYRDSNYDDLITFEEDIAKISSIVLVIAESSGSLAELGAFVSSGEINPYLRVIISENHEQSESFVRYGPIERLKNRNRDNLGVYPWKNHSNGLLNVKQTKDHYREIVSFINSHIEKSPISSLYRNLNKENLEHLPYILLWIIHISLCITTKTLYDLVKEILPETKDKDIRNKLYCLQFAKWIKKYPYGGKDYFFTTFDNDPIDFHYKKNALNKNTIQRKLITRMEISSLDHIPDYVSKLASNYRVNS